MSAFDTRPAVRENVGLFIGLGGGTGSGKTWSAMELAAGICGDERFCVIDTENRRSLHYADFFKFDVMEFPSPYSSERYGEAVQTAYDKGYKAIVLDSASHEHDGIGGYLDTQAQDLEERVERAKKKHPEKSEWQLAEQLTPLSWNKPKRARKRMLQIEWECSTTIPIIFCFRAEEKVFQSKEGKLVAMNPPVWEPICGKGMPFEMTAFFMLHRDRPGVPKPIKLQEQHKALFPLDTPLTRESGRRIAEWAKGTPRAVITADQVTDILDRLADKNIPPDRLCRVAEVKTIAEISDYQRALRWIEKQGGSSSEPTE